jgi:hypothetical protein
MIATGTGVAASGVIARTTAIFGAGNFRSARKLMGWTVPASIFPGQSKLPQPLSRSSRLAFASFITRYTGGAYRSGYGGYRGYGYRDYGYSAVAAAARRFPICGPV